MKIALIGYGKMGREIELAAHVRNHEIVAKIDSHADDATHQDINEESLNNADVVIDFTHPDSAIANINAVAAAGKDLVVGTTGWYDQEDAVRKTVEESGIGFLYSSNFSIGVNAFFKIVGYAAALFDKLEDYDVFGYEMHHKQKADSPSGTAVTLGGILLDNIERKKTLQTEKLDRAPTPEELHFGSVRAGNIPGTHVIGFESGADIVELKHTARNRSGFAMGAVIAAEWIHGKKGFHTFTDFMESLND